MKQVLEREHDLRGLRHHGRLVGAVEQHDVHLRALLVGATLESYAEGLALAIVAGIAVGVVIGSSRTLLDASSAVIEFLRPIPAVALIPLAIMIFGLGVPMRRFVIACAALWPILVNTLYGVRSGSRRSRPRVARWARSSGSTAPTGR